ncbi:pyruvate, phosphate dikinase [Kiritimatiella glycovorans]|uniref:Pyruvate, phosphate dikinase n=1 Tax=Kiritimatiella glycovorans TaxID=1307763 RepID=A0A0G3EK46_9BACT|nr:pyruvate, phosphate dikinase [Kiritimatiella glycovorans]AKJ65180.1 Pyruvate, phosphate dikinase [Kiritimatiella glycovorans]
MAKKYVYFYGLSEEQTEGDRSMKAILGGKGANLAEMSNAGLPVPPGFTLSTEACKYYSEHGGKYPQGLEKEIRAHLDQLEKGMGKKLGDPDNPLLVSVRSGAAISMPGMMDTVLNLGLNDKSVQGFIKQTGSERAGWDCYRRFIDMFGDVVMGPYTGLKHEHFEHEIEKLKKKYGAKEDTDLTAEQLKELVGIYKKVYQDKVKKPFPQDPEQQLDLSIRAVFGSWDSDRAVKYRQINKISGLLGTAVNVCTMVFGNMGDDCGTGVAFTRDPSTGESVAYGDYLKNAQGEDVVAGIRTPKHMNDMAKDKSPAWRKTHKELIQIMKRLEKHYKHPQDIEFTVERGKLWLLQTRNAKRTGIAGVRWAVEMATGKDVFTGKKQTKILSQKDALMNVGGSDLEQLLFPVFDMKEEKKANVIAEGLPAGPGAASGTIVFDADDAEAAVEKDKNARVILVRRDTSPEDVGGMWAARGVLTSTGGMTSHAAVVARGWGKCCICGASALNIDYKKKQVTVGKKVYKEGDSISLNGSTGKVYEGEIPLQSSPVVEAVIGGKAAAKKHPYYRMYEMLSGWSDTHRKMKVRTNADAPKDAAAAKGFGAEGIGLCRTEHMFFEGDRIWSIREFILAEDREGREKALKDLLKHQQKDFEGIFKEMDGLPVTVRLLDPPLHEFVPHEKKEQQEMARRLGVSARKVADRVRQLHEFNPMLGHRGCRLSITYPELCVMQTKAIIGAACKVSKLKNAVKVHPEIMVPLVGSKTELDYLENVIRTTADEIIERTGAKVKYMVGTMIEVPRAALTADQIADRAEFFSFGTNDLTQMTFGFSRDDVGTFLPEYTNRKILDVDPFQHLDQEGVGQLVKMGVERGRSVRGDLKCGICGEHGGDPDSVRFCYESGLDYVSCSPYRVPIARLAAAQAAIEE